MRELRMEVLMGACMLAGESDDEEAGIVADTTFEISPTADVMIGQQRSPAFGLLHNGRYASASF